MGKVLLISFLYYPSSSVGARRIYNFKKYLLKAGIMTTVLTVKKGGYYPTDSSLPVQEDDENVERTGCLVPRHPYHLRSRKNIFSFLCWEITRVIHWASLKVFFPDVYIGWLPFALIRGMALHRKYRYDVIIATGRPWTDFVVGDALAALSRRPLILDYRDPWTAYENATYGSQMIKRLSLWYERSLLKRASRVIVNTDDTKELFARRYAGEFSDKVRVIRNGYDPEVKAQLKNGCSAEETIDEEKKGFFRLVYTGNFNNERRADSLLRAVFELKREGILSEKNFRLVSYGFFEKKDRTLVAELNLADVVEEKDFVSYEASLKKLCAATMNLIVVGRQHGSMVPAKIYDYLMVERPIFGIGPTGSEVERIINKHNYGVFCDVENHQEIESSLKFLLEEHSRGGLKFQLRAPEEYSVHARVGELAEIIREQAGRKTETRK